MHKVTQKLAKSSKSFWNANTRSAGSCISVAHEAPPSSSESASYSWQQMNVSQHGVGVTLVHHEKALHLSSADGFSQRQCEACKLPSSRLRLLWIEAQEHLGQLVLRAVVHKFFHVHSAWPYQCWVQSEAEIVNVCTCIYISSLSPSSLSSFKSKLKTHLFSSAHWSVIFFPSHSTYPSPYIYLLCVCVLKSAYPYVFVRAPGSYKMRCHK